MKYMLKASLAAAALVAAPVLVASPALAGHSPVTVTQANPNLTTKIKADTSKEPMNDNVVFGTTGTAPQNVRFVGNTAIDITDGAGFAVITDAGGANDFFQLLINPDEAFFQYEFSVSLADAGRITFEYLLSGGTWQVISFMDQQANANVSYLIDSGGLALDAIRFTSTSAINFQRQNAISLAPGAVPEPGSWAMMLLGFAGIGTAARRARKKVSLLQIA